MIEALLLAATQPAMTAIDAERAFAAEAHKSGQWTAFRKYAADGAIMFTPQAGPAKDFLKDKADPPVAVFWWPGRSYVSCDGSTAVNTGPWAREWGKSVGYFTTVWQRQPDGRWKWLLDHGDSLAAPRAEGGDIKAEKASCPQYLPPPNYLDEVPTGARHGFGSSSDGSLRWEWLVHPNGSRTFTASIWDGHRYKIVISDSVKAQ
jgi:hypothetical protein